VLKWGYLSAGTENMEMGVAGVARPPRMRAQDRHRVWLHGGIVASLFYAVGSRRSAGRQDGTEAKVMVNRPSLR